MQAGQPPETPTAPERREPPTMTDEQLERARQLLHFAIRAENLAAWKASGDCETAAQVREAMKSATFELRMAGPPPQGHRVWWLPNVFADVVLVVPGGMTLRFKCDDVRKLWVWMKETGVLK